MDLKNFVKNERGVASTYSYILIFALTVILFTSVLGIYTVSMNQKTQQAERQQLTAIGQKIAIHIEDISNSPVENGYCEKKLRLPRKVAGNPYTVKIRPEKEEIVLQTETGTTVKVPLNGYQESTKINVTIYSTNFKTTQQGL